MEADDNLASLKERQEALKSIMDPSFFQAMYKYGITRLIVVFNIRYNVQRGFRGLMLDDLILEVLQSFITEGGRNWNKTKFPNFKKQFLSAFDSHICNSISKELEKTILTESDEKHNLQEIKSTNEDSNYDDLINTCLDVLEKNGASYEEIQLFEPYYINKMKRVDVAELMKISVEEVTNVKAKLDRKLPLLRNFLKNNQL